MYTFRFNSKFSLAFLKDSNWYAHVDMDLAETYVWGRNKGCDFIEKACCSET